MIKNFFRRKKEGPEPVALDHPRKLKTGDAIKFGLDEHSEISDSEFFIEKVTGLDILAKAGYERRMFHLGRTSDNRTLVMWVDEASGGDQIAIAYGAEQPHVEQMIDVGQFGELFQPERDYLVEVESLPGALANNPWLAPAYVQDQGQEVYWLDKDPVDVTTQDTTSSDEEPCDYFRLSAKDGSAAIEAFVFEGGQTDVYFVKYFPLYKIEEMMPSA